MYTVIVNRAGEKYAAKKLVTVHWIYYFLFRGPTYVMFHLLMLRVVGICMASFDHKMSPHLLPINCLMRF